ncbi:MAG: hypothetical protein K0Q49_1916 [Haloplasmataceae bacterium]|jgi:aminoglycoside phosphotransferase|nr:hypothetical protein [Haloplasmataceae bacterium]
MFKSQTINQFIENKMIERNTIGASSSEVYKINNITENRNGYLKVDTNDNNFGVNHEYDVILFLKDKFKVADLFYYEYPYLLTYELEGLPGFLQNDITEAIKIIAKSLKLLHSLIIKNCSIISELKSNTNYEFNDLVFVHGDACLPNFIINHHELTGIIDLGAAGIGDRYEDLALCTWSILYNFKDMKYVILFFEEYGKTYYDLAKILTFLKLQEMNIDVITKYL